MKRKVVKNLVVLVMAVLLTMSMTACGGGEETVLNGYYTSSQNMDFFSAYPQFTFKMMTVGVQTIETYSDGSYCMTVTTSAYSGSLQFNDDGTHEEVPRGVKAVRYYGTFTETEEAGLLTLTLSAPTSVAVSSNYAIGETAVGYVDTSAWTEEMGEIAGGEAGAMSAEDYLYTLAFEEISIIVDTATDTFDYAQLTIPGAVVPGTSE